MKAIKRIQATIKAIESIKTQLRQKMMLFIITNKGTIMEAVTELTIQEDDIIESSLYLSDDYDNQEFLESLLFHGFDR